MADIFISYARSDRARAKALAEVLEEHGYDVWWDFELVPGERFSKVIEKVLGEAKCVIVLWSKESVESEWVETEAAEGRRQNKLVPALIDDVAIPLAFRQIHTADLRDWEKGKPHFDFTSILKAIVEIAGDPLAEEPVEDVKLKPLPPITEPSTKRPPPKPEVPESGEPPKISRVLVIGVPIGLALILLIGALWYTSQPAKTFTNSIGMKFVLIPAGTFKMGSHVSPEEVAKEYGGGAEWSEDEQPLHDVTLSNPFYMLTTEVTQWQWKKVMGNNPSRFKSCGDDCPVEGVAWEDAQGFVRKLNSMEGTDKYRLPTEAEWEYACRAGSTTEYYFGDSESGLNAYAWYRSNSQDMTHLVGLKKPNAWGLYDMHGNVSEWCQDRYDQNYYSRSPPRDPEGPSSGEQRVMRGGSFVSHGRYVRSASRNKALPGWRFSEGLHGLRVVRAP